jgi:hypothetical protein
MVKVFGVLGAVGNLQGGRAVRNSADRFEPEKWGKTKWGGCLVRLTDAMDEGGGGNDTDRWAPVSNWFKLGKLIQTCLNLFQIISNLI